MTVLEFFGCGLLAFGSPLILFILTVANEPIRIIICMSSSFFWLVSLLLSSVLWFAVVPLHNQLAFGMVFSVLFQEAFRYLLYKTLRLAEKGMERIIDNGRPMASLHTLAFVCGLGFGMISGIFSLVNVLSDSLGPGTIGLRGGSDMFFFVSAFHTLCFILLHTFWSVVFFNALDRRNVYGVVGVLAAHLVVSSLTLMNREGRYGVVCPAIAGITLASAYWSLRVAGGSATRVFRVFFSVAR